ncbi:MAG: ribose-phosphate pyrophosphokinase, partial [Gammaproteobacteria bacterium]
LFGYDDLAKNIHEKLKYEIGIITQHQFPDDETVIRIDSHVADREVIFIASLDRPNSKLLPLLFAAETARRLAANKITLIAPYLAYMRQDKEFHPGEGITSRYFAKLISTYFDKLITIDPHLHRWHSLKDIYSISTSVLHATDNIAGWINNNIKNPVLIGPDIESTQWVEGIAKKSTSPFLILEKIRKGDTNVEVSIPEIENYRNATPILVDDIISTAMTMIETVNHLKSLQINPPVCIGVHAVFAGNSYQKLAKSGVKKIVTCNTIKHVSNEIDISNIVIETLCSEQGERNVT